MWYRWSQEQEFETPPDQWGISSKQVDDMIQRIRGAYGHYLRDEGRSWKDVSDNELGMEAMNDYEIYHRYLENLPEDVSVYDVLRAYRSGSLPYTIVPSQKKQPFDITDALDIETTGLPWEPQQYTTLTDEELTDLVGIAKGRLTKTNRGKVNDARYQIFLASFKDPTLCKRLGIKQSELNKILKTWTNMPAKSRELEQRINQTASNLTVEWTGISNSAMIAQNRISIDDIDGFFREITLNPVLKEMGYVDGSDVAIDLNAEWNSRRGELLRAYILRTILAIDTHISYRNLGFNITNVLNHESKTARGLYSSQRKTIEIKNEHPDTVAHEIGHYIDNQWMTDLTGNSVSPVFLSEANVNSDLIFEAGSKERQFYDIYQEFVMDISERAATSSAYLQKRNEVFARFIASFVNWTHEKSGWYKYEENYGDKFNEGDYLRFIRILQMKAYLDAQRSQIGLNPEPPML